MRSWDELSATTQRQKLAAVGLYEPKSNRKLTDQQIADIIRRNAAGEKQNALANEYGISRARVSYIICHRLRRS